MARQNFEAKQARLLDEIADEARLTRKWTGRASFSDAVMEVMARVARHEFMAPKEAPFAYVNRPYPIGFGQTISQPYIVALMTDLLELTADARVLEIGTGSGYQTAVLASLAARVYSIEVILQLADAARRRLDRLGFKNVSVKTGDGREGWAEAAPYDAIMVTAAAQSIPPRLVDQLAPGGRMAIPVGERRGEQKLLLGTKDAVGDFKTRTVLGVAFVPLVTSQPN